MNRRGLIAAASATVLAGLPRLTPAVDLFETGGIMGRQIVIVRGNAGNPAEATAMIGTGQLHTIGGRGMRAQASFIAGLFNATP